jgi:hypothetical protein
MEGLGAAWLYAASQPAVHRLPLVSHQRGDLRRWPDALCAAADGVIEASRQSARAFGPRASSACRQAGAKGGDQHVHGSCTKFAASPFNCFFHAPLCVQRSFLERSEHLFNRALEIGQNIWDLDRVGTAQGTRNTTGAEEQYRAVQWIARRGFGLRSAAPRAGGGFAGFVGFSSDAAREIPGTNSASNSSRLGDRLERQVLDTGRIAAGVRQIRYNCNDPPDRHRENDWHTISNLVRRLLPPVCRLSRSRRPAVPRGRLPRR